MEEEKFQKELFEFEQPKKPFSRLTDILPKADFDGRVAITLTLEKVVFIFIGIIMAMVIVYALGVESGKSRTGSNVRAATKQVMPPAIATVSQPRASNIAAKNIFNTAPIAPANRPAAPVKLGAQAPSARPYTILAGSYLKRESAQASAAILAKQGFNVTITYSEPYYRVCAGTYADKTGIEVQKDLLKVRRFYKDAMLKLR